MWQVELPIFESQDCIKYGLCVPVSEPKDLDLACSCAKIEMLNYAKLRGISSKYFVLHAWPRLPDLSELNASDTPFVSAILEDSPAAAVLPLEAGHNSHRF